MNKKVITGIIGIIVVMIIVIIIGTQTIRTSAANDFSDLTRCYASIEIEPNESLWSIANEYASEYGISTEAYMNELRQVNNLSSDKILAGAHLIVVYWE